MWQWQQNKIHLPMKWANVTAICREALKATHDIRPGSFSLSCETLCVSNSYTPQPSNTTLSYYDENWDVELWTLAYIPTCYPCPVGATCDKTLQSLPNYWGFKNKSDFVWMVRCPDEYCCPNHQTCEGIQSCGPGREGTLCGKCHSNLTESIFSPQCVSTTECNSILVAFLFCTCVLGYSLVLLVSQTIKDRIIGICRKLAERWKERRNKIKSAESDTLDLETSSGTGDDATKERKKESAIISVEPDSGMKYIQILFYYIQDAVLFKVHLPADGQNEQCCCQGYWVFAWNSGHSLYKGNKNVFRRGSWCRH